MNPDAVSPFRLSNELFIPKDAEFVSLVPVNYNNDTLTPDVYAAFETSDNAFFTITCDIAGKFSKVFLTMRSKTQRHGHWRERHRLLLAAVGCTFDCFVSVCVLRLPFPFFDIPCSLT